MDIVVHEGDLPDDLVLGEVVALDSETMGLDPFRDRLCLVQLTDGAGRIHLVHFPPGGYAAPILCRLLTDPTRLKLFHYARFDVAVLRHFLGVTCRPVYCTKIASKLVRTYTDRHGLKDICRELLGLELNENEQSSYWGAESLSDAQLRYAAGDVAHLHQLMSRLDDMLEREGRTALARACFEFLPVRAELDLAGWAEQDIFAH